MTVAVNEFPRAASTASSAAERSDALGWLQVLRGLAALAVVLFHFKEPMARDWPVLARLFAGGAMGVDVFFVLSGFIICYATRSVRSQQPGAFLVRRFARIIPPAWAVMVLMMIARPPYLKDLISGFLFVLPASSPAPHYGHGFLIVAWTLTYELYFYAMFALSIALSRRLGWHRATVCVALMLLVMGSAQLLLGGVTLSPLGAPDWRPLPAVSGASLFGVMANPMIVEFLFGVGLALVHQRWLQRLSLRSAALTAVLCAGLAAVWVSGLTNALGEVVQGPLGAGGPAVLIVLSVLAVQRLDDVAGRRWLALLVGRMVAHLGDVSYSLYLVHPVLRAVLVTAGAKLGWPTGAMVSALGIMLSVIAASVLYRWVEVPSQALGRRWAQAVSRDRSPA
ncbi:MAG TPA: acyltransferase [Roseateles sp.]